MFFGGDPFEHFAHHGGGGSRRSARPAADVDTNKLYETLGVREKNVVDLSLICHLSLCAFAKVSQ